MPGSGVLPSVPVVPVHHGHQADRVFPEAVDHPEAVGLRGAGRVNGFKEAFIANPFFI